MNDPIPDLRFTPTSPQGEALPIIFAATTRPDGSPVIAIELAHGESIAEVLPADRDRIMAALDRAIAAACWLLETPGDATANPREAVVVKCADGWLIATRDMKHWWSKCGVSGWHPLLPPFRVGNFRTEAEARAALAKAPPPPEVGT